MHISVHCLGSEGPGPGAMPGSLQVHALGIDILSTISLSTRVLFAPVCQKKIEVNIPYSRHVLTGVNAYAYVCLPLIFVSGLFIFPSLCGNVLTQPISDVLPLPFTRR